MRQIRTENAMTSIDFRLPAAGLSALLACAARGQRAARAGEKVSQRDRAVATPLTGDTGAEGQGIKRAVIMAVEEANASHRFPYKLAAAPFDDRADPKEAVNVANLIISDPRIVAVVGHYTSGCSIPAAKVYARAPIAMISPGATNPEVTAQQLSPDWIGPRVVFRDVATDDVQGAYAAEFAYKRLGKRGACRPASTTRRPTASGLDRAVPDHLRVSRRQDRQPRRHLGRRPRLQGAAHEDPRRRQGGPRASTSAAFTPRRA